MPECRHHVICGLTDEADPAAGLCILYSHQTDKDPEAFTTALRKHRGTRGDRFAYMVFPMGANFREATFTEGANFGSTTFHDWASFEQAKFSKGLDLTRVAFKAAADFGGATFSGRLSCPGTTFAAIADFHEATFTQAHFNHTTFAGRTAFAMATFTGLANFLGTTFTAEACFERANFSAGADFSETTFAAEADFSEATFSGSARFLDTTFATKAHFRGGQMRGSTLFTGRQAEEAHQIHPLSPVASYFDFCDLVIESSASLGFRHMDFRACYFLNTDLRKIDAQTLAQLAMMLQPTPWTPPPPIYDELQQRLAQRDALLDLQQQVRHQLHALEQLLVVMETVRQRFMQLLTTFAIQLATVVAEITEAWQHDAAWATAAQRLQSIKGIGWVTAAWTLVTTLNFTTCDTVESLTAYAGLAPMPHQSGTSVRHGPPAATDGKFTVSLSDVN